MTTSSEQAPRFRSAEVERGAGRPPVRPAEIRRSDLLDLFVPFRDRKIVLLTAPAGYGKSIFAAQWCAADSERVTAWVSLSEAHDDPVVLLNDVLTVVPGTIVSGPALAASVATGDPASDLSTDLRQALAGTEPFSLVFDDVHRVTNTRSRRLLELLIDALPQGCQAVLASRGEPAIGISRRRANGELLQIRPEHLAMDLSTTQQYLAAAHVDLSPDAVIELHRTTEGWPAGIGLAAFAHTSSGTFGGFAPGPTGGHRDISDYLVDEVLARQELPMQEFLLATSVLSRFSADLCDAMLDTTGSDQLIRQIERTNLFVIPMDGHRNWFRYHHLFQELLASELDRTRPGARQQLLRKAAAWHDERGTVEEALQYAQDGGDNHLAGSLVLRHWQQYGTRGQIETLRSWVARSSDEDIASDAALAIGAGWVNMLLGDVERAERYAADAAHHDLDGPSPDGASSVRSSLANLRSGLGSGGVMQMLEDGLLVQEAERPGRTRWLVGGCRAVGTAHLVLGNIDEAVLAFDEALLLTDNHPELRFVRVFCLGYLSLALLDQSDIDRARLLSDEAVDLMGAGTVLQTFQALPGRTANAALLARSGDRTATAAAVEATTVALDVMNAAPWMLADLAVRNAEIACDIGEASTARNLIARASRALARLPDAGTIPDRLEAVRLRAQAANSLASTLSPAERRVLQQLASHRTLGEIGDELYISRSTVKTHVKSIYTKLGVSSRAEAVARLGP